MHFRVHESRRGVIIFIESDGNVLRLLKCILRYNRPSNEIKSARESHNKIITRLCRAGGVRGPQLFRRGCPKRRKGMALTEEGEASGFKATVSGVYTGNYFTIL